MTLSIRASYARLAMTAMGRHDIRYYLNGIYVEPRAAGGAFIICTDGHRMMAIIDVDAKCEQATILSPDKATAARLPQIGSMADTDQATLELTEFQGKPALMVTGEKGNPVHLQISSAVVAGADMFPAWSKVLPKFDKLQRGITGFVRPAYTTAFLSAFSKARLQSSRSWLGTTYYQENKDSAAVIRFSGHDNMLYLVMPMRENDGQDAPWLKGWEEAKEHASKRRDTLVAEARAKKAAEDAAKAGDSAQLQASIPG